MRCAYCALRSWRCAPQSRTCRFRGYDGCDLSAPTTNAVIRKSLQVLGAIDIAQVHQHGLLHHPLEALEVEGAKLLPFGDDDEGVAVFGAGVGTVAESVASTHLPRRLHPHPL